jgi:hypothetical protein
MFVPLGLSERAGELRYCYYVQDEGGSWRARRTLSAPRARRPRHLIFLDFLDLAVLRSGDSSFCERFNSKAL